MAKVMLVEDDNNLREIYEARLLAEGYEIISANDGEEALALAVREKPDLIISDVMMPKISGFDMLDILRGSPETKNTKVIMMTALSQIEDKDRADKLGADRYLVKSQVTLEDVVRVAREVLEGSSEAPLPEPAAAPVPAAPVPEPAAAAAPQPATPPPAPAPAEPVASMPLATPPADPAPTPATPDPAVAPAAQPAPDPAPATPPADPVPAPEPPSTDAEAAADTTQDSSAAANLQAAEQLIAQAQSSDSEQQTVDQQIETFEKSEVVPPPIQVDEDGNITQAAPAEEQPAAEPADLKLPEPTPPEPAADPTTAPVIDSEPSAEASTAAEDPAASPAVGGTKVIQPLNDPTVKPDINELLAKEEEKEQMSQILGTAGVAPMPPTPPEAPLPPQAGSEPAPAAQPAPAETKQDDPGAIAL